MVNYRRKFITLAPECKHGKSYIIPVIPADNVIETFCLGNLLPFHGNTVILCYKAHLVFIAEWQYILWPKVL
jgi:hypothetical protein